MVDYMHIHISFRYIIYEHNLHIVCESMTCVLILVHGIHVHAVYKARRKQKYQYMHYMRTHNQLWIKWMHGTVFTQGKIPTEKQGQELVSLTIDNHLGWCVSLGCLVGEKVLYDDVNLCLKLHFAPVRVELEWQSQIHRQSFRFLAPCAHWPTKHMVVKSNGWTLCAIVYSRSFLRLTDANIFL